MLLHFDLLIQSYFLSTVLFHLAVGLYKGQALQMTEKCISVLLLLIQNSLIVNFENVYFLGTEDYYFYVNALFFVY